VSWPIVLLSTTDACNHATFNLLLQIESFFQRYDRCSEELSGFSRLGEVASACHMRWESKLWIAQPSLFCTREALYGVFYIVLLLEKAFGGVHSEKRFARHSCLRRVAESVTRARYSYRTQKVFFLFIVRFCAFESWKEQASFEPEFVAVLSAFSRHLVQGDFASYVPATPAMPNAFVHNPN
jgi:hypothetical protein